MNADTNKSPHFGRIIHGRKTRRGTADEAEILQEKLKLNRSYQCKVILKKKTQLKHSRGWFREEHR